MKVRSLLMVGCLILGSTCLNATLAVADMIIIPRSNDLGTEQRSGAPIEGAASPASTITVNFDLPLTKAQAIINLFSYKFSGTGTIPFLSFLKYDFTATVNNINLSSSGTDGLPIHLVASFELKGKIAGVDLNETGKATIDFGVDFGTDWCPGLIFSDAVVTLDHPRAVDRSIGDLSKPMAFFLNRELKGDLSCQKLREQKIWGAASWPFQIMGRTIYFDINPQSIALSKLQVTGDRLAVKVTLMARTAITTRRISTKQGKLPRSITRIENPSSGSPVSDLGGSVDGNLGLGR